jgi:2-polyprenyl-3-methyl-5-hydroxy-6-metoxy-1,4-benzoquinol methylase
MDQLQQIQDDEYSFPYHYVSQFKNGFTQTFFDNWGINYCATIEFLLHKLNQESAESIIDVGCGDGRLVCELQEAFAEKTISGIDYSTRAIALAKAINPRGDYKQLDIINQELSQQYDMAILMEVFEHIDPSLAIAFVEGIRKLLKPGGKLWVTVPHENKAVEYKHYRHFTGESLVACFEKHFTVNEIIPFEKGKKRKKIIDALLGNRFFILNSNRLKNMIYTYYKKNIFYAAEDNCNRIFVSFTLK